MIPRTIHQIHLGEEPDEVTAKCIATVKDKNPTWRHILWGNYEVGELARELGLERQIILPTYAAITNLLRLHILYQYGGVYLDTDVECLRPLEELGTEHYTAFAAMQDGNRICNAIMGADYWHPWIKWQIDNWGVKFPAADPVSGVLLATEAPRDRLSIISPELVYPFMYFIPKEQRFAHPNSVLVHHWAGSWAK